jgi:predicted RNA-binding protein with PIN domain
VVDAMNVIGSRPDKWWNDPDAAMLRFLDELVDFAERNEDEVTVVYDRLPKGLDEGPHQGVEVVEATRRGRNAADHRIGELVRGDSDAGSLLVVTSDRKLADDVRAVGATVVGSGSFLRQLERSGP